MNPHRGIGFLIILFSLFLFSISGEAQEKKGRWEKRRERAPDGKGFWIYCQPRSHRYHLRHCGGRSEKEHGHL